MEQELVEQQISPQKQAILETAQVLFTTQGYSGLSIRDLAEHCGLAKATIYHHFRDKEDLFFTVLQHELVTVNRQIMEATAGVNSPIAKLSIAVHTYCQLLLERRSGVLWAIHETAEIKAQLQHFFHTQQDMLFEPLTNILRQGIEEGVFRPVDLPMSALSLLSMLNALVFYQARLAATSGVNNDVANVAEYVLTLFLQGIVGSNSPVLHTQN